MRHEFQVVVGLLTLLAAGGIAPARGAQIKVGDGTIDGSLIAPYENVWRMSVKRPDGASTVIGLWTDRLFRDQLDGKPVFERIQGMTYPKGLSSSTINVFDPATLRPIWSEDRGPMGVFLHRDFVGGKVAARRSPKPGAAETTSETDLGTPVYDFWGGMYGLLLAALPLTEGQSVTLPTVAELEDKLQPVTAKVTGRQKMAAGARGTVDTWVVECEGMTFYLSRQPPYIIKLVYVDPDRKTETTWEML